MRGTLALPFALFASTSLFAVGALAADADLPAGDEPPRIVPMAVVDSYFAYDLPALPTAPRVGSTTFATSATRHDEFAVNLASIGARLEHSHLIGAIALQAGTSVDALYSGSQADDSFLKPELYKHIQVAYAGYRQGDVAFTMGLFPSVFGVEAFQTTSNWNYTKSFIGDLTPYFQEGAKVEWRFLPGFKLTGVVDNGWTTHGHLKTTPSYAGRVDWEVNDDVQLWDAFHVGKESILQAGDLRVYDELAIKANVGKQVSAALQGWLTRQGSATAYGGVAWAKWSFVERAYVALRGEYYRDQSAILFEGMGPPMIPDPLQGNTFVAGTATVGWTPQPNFVVKVEGSYRKSKDPAFYGASSTVNTYVAAASGPTQIPAPDATHSTTLLASAAFFY